MKVFMNVETDGREVVHEGEMRHAIEAMVHTLGGVGDVASVCECACSTVEAWVRGSHLPSMKNFEILVDLSGAVFGFHIPEIVIKRKTTE